MSQFACFSFFVQFFFFLLKSLKFEILQRQLALHNFISARPHMSFFAQTLYRRSATFPVTSPHMLWLDHHPPRLQIMTSSLSLSVSASQTISRLSVWNIIPSSTEVMTFIIFYFTSDAFGRAGGFNILEGAGMAVVVGSLERICWERQRSWSSGHLNVRVFHWRIQIREGAAFVVLVCLVPNEIPLSLIIMWFWDDAWW